MQGLAGGSQAPLGLLLICLYLPGLFARSIGAPEEKISPHSGKPSFASLFKLETAGLGQPQSKPDLVNHEPPRVLPRFPGFLQDGALPEVPSQPPFWGEYPMEFWLSEEDPRQGMGAAAEDRLERALPEALPYLSRGRPLPMASSAYETYGPEDSESVQPGSSPLRTEAEAFAQHPFLYFIHRLLPGFPWGILSPSASWGAGGAGTGWGRRPMPFPSGIWGSNSQLAGSWGGNGRYPAGGWGANGRYPAGSWGSNGRYPAGSWGSNGRCVYPLDSLASPQIQEAGQLVGEKQVGPKGWEPPARVGHAVLVSVDSV
ncbi:uncharacterized protein C6orf15 homolog [Microtus pennsylvanicus]|uniref:uncharacterized protein C6orf15 homolog n=1 Tax=Microtus pennsylvanicus TaxID=10058 RepID=UPI003F6A5F30